MADLVTYDLSDPIVRVNTREKRQGPVHHRGGQSSYLLLGGGEFGSAHLAITWVDCAPGGQQDLHRHEIEEQVSVITRGRGVMIVGDEEQEVAEGTLVYVPPGSDHAIRNTSAEPMSYVSATSAPFDPVLGDSLYVDPAQARNSSRISP